ncbi:DUF975 family protein [Enterococcus thailandicus]|uniref:DUF975 family protein n=1 Tax=Enterococcus thailandicus TaxID=417368 RepID=UPI0022EBFE05|nr:DUF975 family protein [Enterococcus thailandicus]MDA3973389.1 DUF975 family protein [Enterococcus thailandicus]MDA3976026.1 DUF975 family protein [Enterococcus thailandicus]MDA3980848.1 DUF975 family protein [Enterococcus thailandicus]
MNKTVNISDYRAQARTALKEQWGINAGLIFLAGLISGIIEMIFGNITSFAPDSTQENILNFLLDNFLLFAFTYSLVYIALFVMRGGKAKMNLLLVVFQKEYFVPLLLIHLLNTVVNWLINSLVFLPAILMSGVRSYASLILNSSGTVAVSVSEGGFLDFGVIFGMLLLLFISVILMNIVGGLFQFAVWAKFDYPELTVMQALRYAWYLMKDRWFTYILLQLSFVGWYILGALALVFGLLWVIAYVNVTAAGFYDHARNEKGAPAEYFAQV